MLSNAPLSSDDLEALRPLAPEVKVVTAHFLNRDTMVWVLECGHSFSGSSPQFETVPATHRCLACAFHKADALLRKL